MAKSFFEKLSRKLGLATGRLVDKAREKGLDKKAEVAVDKTHDTLKRWLQSDEKEGSGEDEKAHEKARAERDDEAADKAESEREEETRPAQGEPKQTGPREGGPKESRPTGNESESGAGDGC